MKNGLKLDGKKDATLTPWTAARPALPLRVRIPLVDPSGKKASPLVKEGDRVLRGQKIAETKNGPAFHASLSGKVLSISDQIEIISDGKDEPVSETLGRERKKWENLSREEVTALLVENGIAVPESDFTAVVINACESEPYLTSDHSLLMSHSVEILKAGKILQKVLNAPELVIALEDNKSEVSELLKSKIFFHSWSRAKVVAFPACYPQENEEILRRDLFAEKTSVHFVSAAEAFAVYEAVALQKPFYERIVTVAGECVAQPRNFWIRVGTSIEDSAKFAKGFLRKPARILLGGPMKGTAAEAPDTPVLKDTRAVLGLPPEIVKPETVHPCIRCGWCVEACPVSISPVMITLAAERDLFAIAEEHGASQCIECGNCSYVCPSKRPMVELIRYARRG